MLKRLLTYLRRRKPDPLPSPSQTPEDDVYLIGVTLQVEVSAEPRDTFSARAQALLFKALQTSAARITRSIFVPTGDGKVELHEIPPSRRKQ